MKLKIILAFAKSIGIDLVILASCIGVFLFLGLRYKPVRVGDGSEYYALFLAWDNTHRPYMTDSSFTDYQDIRNSQQITGMMVLTTLKSISIPLGSTADLPHFWFYSFCAAVFATLAAVIGIHVQVQTAFLMLHCFLLILLLIMAWRCFRWKGLVAAAILTFSSPMIWYFNKVHTEFFTFCVTTCAVILFLKRKFFFSAFFIGLASTQNISFAAVSLMVIAIGVWQKRKDKITIRDYAPIALAICVIGVQPAYYYLRFHQWLPQFIQGTARIGENLRYFYIWLFDPDVGLLPNWPFGIVLLGLAFFAILSRKVNRSSVFVWLVFGATFIGVSILAQSSTTNINSAATPGVARYALWYLCLFFPAALLVIEKSLYFKWYSALTVVLIVLSLIFSEKFFRPSLSENGYIKPSLVSYWAQKNIPGVYNPPPEIFEERYSGIGEGIEFTNAFAVLGPDCHKVLVIRNTAESNKVVYGGSGCGLDQKNVSQFIQRNLENGIWTIKTEPIYVRLNDARVNP